MKKERIEFYDFLRGIAIIMVVGIHTFKAYPIDTPMGFIVTFIRQILNCAVPIFLGLSGLFCSKKILGTKAAYISFLTKQIPKVYIPALIWSLPYFMQNVIGLNRGGYSPAVQAITLFMCGYSIYYFIALIVQYYFLLPILQKYKSVMMPISIISSMLSITIITFLTKILGIQIPLIVFAGPFTTWFVFFMLGVYYTTSPINYTIKQSAAITILGLMLEYIETYYLNMNYGGGYGIKISSFIYSIGIVMLLLTPKMKSMYKSNKLTFTIAYLGRISFGIYLIHYFVIKISTFILPLRSWALSWIIVIMITAIVIMLFRKYLPQKINKYLGFS